MANIQVRYSCRRSGPGCRSCTYRRRFRPRPERISAARDASAGHLEADELALQSGLLDRDEGLLAHEHRFIELRAPAEASPERVRRLVDVVAVEREARLETQGIASAESDRLRAERHELVPELRRRSTGRRSRRLFLARVAGARRGARHAAFDGAVAEVEVSARAASPRLRRPDRGCRRPSAPGARGSAVGVREVLERAVVPAAFSKCAAILSWFEALQTMSQRSFDAR